MRFVQDVNSSVNVIRGYDRGELRVNDRTYRGSLIVGPSAVTVLGDLGAVDQLHERHAAQILEYEPEVVLAGTGSRQVFPAASFASRFLSMGIGFEAMDTGAACRTFNVLVGEQRRVVALLIA